MEKLTRWLFSLVTAALLLYACRLFGATQCRLSLAREEVRRLETTRQSLREENEAMTGQIAMEEEDVPSG